MRVPFLRQRPHRPGGDVPPESGKWLWYTLGLLTVLWLLYSWFAGR